MFSCAEGEQSPPKIGQLRINEGRVNPIVHAPGSLRFDAIFKDDFSLKSYQLKVNATEANTSRFKQFPEPISLDTTITMGGTDVVATRYFEILSGQGRGGDYLMELSFEDQSGKSGPVQSIPFVMFYTDPQIHFPSYPRGSDTLSLAAVATHQWEATFFSQTAQLDTLYFQISLLTVNPETEAVEAAPMWRVGAGDISNSFFSLNTTDTLKTAGNYRLDFFVADTEANEANWSLPLKLQ